MKNSMNQDKFNGVVKNFQAKVRHHLKRNSSILTAIKHALAECNKEVAQAILHSVDKEISQESIMSDLEAALENYHTKVMGLLSINDRPFSQLYLLLLQETLLAFHKNQQNSTIDNIEKLSEIFIIPTHPLYALSFAAGDCRALPLIDWKKLPVNLQVENESAESKEKKVIDLILTAILIRHPEMEGFLSVDLIANEMTQARVASSIFEYVNQQCDFMQRTRLLDILNDKCSYNHLAYHLAIICDFDLNAILEARLVEQYIEVKIKEKLGILPEEFFVDSVTISSSSVSQEVQQDFPLKRQIQIVCADRAILYIYQEYLYYHRAELADNGIVIAEAILQDGALYEAWDRNELLKKSTYDSTALYEWFKYNRPYIEAWYKKYYRSYEQRWHDFFFTEVRGRCLLLAENSSSYREKRTVLAQIFDNVTEMYAIFTPYEFFEIINSFENRLANNVELYGREHKELVLIKTIESINRDIAKLLLSTSFLSVTGMRLLESMLHYVEQDEEKYISLLQDLLGSSCPCNGNRAKSRDIFQLEKYFLVFSLLSNLLAYLFTYAYVDNSLPGAKCAWNGVSGSYYGECWGLVKSALFSTSNISAQTLSEALVDPQYYAITIEYFYTKFQANIRETGIIQEDQDLVDVFVPPAPNGFLKKGVFGRSYKHNDAYKNGLSFGSGK